LQFGQNVPHIDRTDRIPRKAVAAGATNADNDLTTIDYWRADHG
jgi:hypothetical protein